MAVVCKRGVSENQAVEGAVAAVEEGFEYAVWSSYTIHLPIYLMACII